MKKHIIKIGVAAVLATVLIVLGFYAQRAFGQAAVAYPNFPQGFQVQPVTLTNVQIATIACVTSSAKLGAQQVTNFPTGIVADTNAIITTSNPFTPSGLSAGGSAILTNNFVVWGQSSNGIVFLSIYNPNTNLLTLPATTLVKLKVESWQ